MIDLKVEHGGKGSRVVDDSTKYLESMTNNMISALARRMESPEAQTSEVYILYGIIPSIRSFIGSWTTNCEYCNSEIEF